MIISRRQFCAAAGSAGLAATAPSPSAADEPSHSAVDEPARPLKVIAYNVYACTGWPKDRPLAKRAVEHDQMARRLAMELALYEPDLINFSESPSEAVAKQVARHLGMHHVRFPSGGNWPGTLLSRYQIVDSQNVPLAGQRPRELFTRHWGRGTIRLPGGESLVVHSAHLHPAADPSTRLKEVRAMLPAMRADLEAGRSMLLIGDLNHTPDSEEYRLWKEAGWIDTFAQVGKGQGLTIKAGRPTRRIDYVLAAGPIADRTLESRPLFQGAFRVNLDDPASFALSDHLPQLAVFAAES